MHLTFHNSRTLPLSDICKNEPYIIRLTSEIPVLCNIYLENSKGVLFEKDSTWINNTPFVLPNDLCLKQFPSDWITLVIQAKFKKDESDEPYDILLDAQAPKKIE